jgi:hypothetical protein
MFLFGLQMDIIIIIDRRSYKLSEFLVRGSIILLKVFFKLLFSLNASVLDFTYFITFEIFPLWSLEL